jgi:cyclic pyranopterin phosphate synthase
VVPRREILERIASTHGGVRALDDEQWAPADRFTTASGATFGIISSTTEPFCRTCDRSRLTADGLWFLCLYARDGRDLRSLVRSHLSDEAIADVLREAWSVRDDRGAEVRAEERERTPFIPISRLRRDPHLEMHTRGG